jgi:hypothetical protein
MKRLKADFSRELEDLGWQFDEEERAERSPAIWWEEDHLEANPNADVLTHALDDLVRGGCIRTDLLEALREVEDLSGGYNVVGRRELPRIIAFMRRLAHALERIEMSPLAYSLPGKRPMTSEDLEAYADMLEAVRVKTRRATVPARRDKIRKLTAYVDKKIRQRGAVGKRRADASLGVLLTEVMPTKVTEAAQRVARSRMQGKKRIPKVKRPRVRALRGSRAGPRNSKRLSFDKLREEGVAALRRFYRDR